MTTVILGSGIIGLSTAYYLSQIVEPSTIHLVDASPRLFASASGYAAGFLAKDWFSPSVAAVGELSFAEHKRLADEFDGRNRWGYLPGVGLNYVSGGADGNKRGTDWLRDGTSRAQEANAEFERVGGEETPEWLWKGDGKVEVIGEKGSVAVADPLRLCKFLLGECLERGVRLHYPYKATSIWKSENGELAGVSLHSLDGDRDLEVSCSRIVIAAGSWSPRVFQTLFPQSKTKIPISSLAGHSVVVKSPRWLKEHEERGSHAVFTTDPDGFSPEVYSRPGEEIWCGGLNDADLALPDVPTDFKTDEAAIERLLVASRKLVGIPGSADDLTVIRKGLCSRPASDSGKPIITRIADSKLGGVSTKAGTEGGIFLNSGHGPWGISLSLGSGKTMAEIITGHKNSADTSGLGLGAG